MNARIHILVELGVVRIRVRVRGRGGDCFLRLHTPFSIVGLATAASSRRAACIKVRVRGRIRVRVRVRTTF